jgi:hypothetical protein
LKLYLYVKEEVKDLEPNGIVPSVSSSATPSGFSKKTKKLQWPSSTMAALAQQQLVQENKQTQQTQNHSKPFEANPGEIKPVVVMMKIPLWQWTTPFGEEVVQ